MQLPQSVPLRGLAAPLLGLITLAGASGLAHRADEPWKAPASAAAKKSPESATAASIGAGKTIYAANCLACHGALGKGDGPAAIALNPRPQDLAASKIMDQSDGAIFWKVTEGRPPMASYKKQLTEVQRWQVVNYVRTLGPTPPTSEAPEALRTAISSVIKAYQPVQTALAKGDAAATTSAVPTLVEATKRLDGADISALDAPSHEAWQANTKALAAAVASLKDAGPTTAKLRDAFRNASDTLTTMIAAFGHNEATPVRIFVASKEAASPMLWLQTAATPTDPYAESPGGPPATLQRQLSSQRPKP